MTYVSRLSCPENNKQTKLIFIQKTVFVYKNLLGFCTKKTFFFVRKYK